MIGISACLLGINCTFKKGNNICSYYIKNILKKNFIPICPEQLGGLCTPRDPSEIINGNGFDVLDRKAKVISNKGIDVSDQFRIGAENALYILKLYNINKVILKERSPSCGVNNIYDGSFTKNKINGSGVAASLFLRNNIEIYNEDEGINII